MRSLRPEVARRAREVLEEKSTDYTIVIEDLECEVLEFEYNQELEQLVGAPRPLTSLGDPGLRSLRARPRKSRRPCGTQWSGWQV